MPLILPDQLPAIDELKQENIFTMGYKRADSQQIRPLRLAVLNLMPLKITTETDFIRILSNSALQIRVEFMKIKSHTSKNTPIEHMLAFYRNFEDMKKEKYDGLIVTGARCWHQNCPSSEVLTMCSMLHTAAIARCIARTSRKCRGCTSSQTARKRV